MTYLCRVLTCPSLRTMAGCHGRFAFCPEELKKSARIVGWLDKHSRICFLVSVPLGQGASKGGSLELGFEDLGFRPRTSGLTPVLITEGSPSGCSAGNMFFEVHFRTVRRMGTWFWHRGQDLFVGEITRGLDMGTINVHLRNLGWPKTSASRADGNRLHDLHRAPSGIA